MPRRLPGIGSGCFELNAMIRSLGWDEKALAIPSNAHRAAASIADAGLDQPVELGLW
jgi:hypothetical protein